MFKNLAEAWKAVVAITISKYTHGTVIVAAGGAIGWIPVLTEFGGPVIAGMGAFMLCKAIVASAKKA